MDDRTARDWLVLAYNNITGEFLLKKRPNGSDVIAARSLITTAAIFVPVFLIKTCTDDGSIMQFSWHELKADINQTLPWLGAIFAAIYIAFYTRYSNQWSYLGNLYNQIMATKSISPDQKNAPLVRWQTGFIVDAMTLHLDRKPIFLGVIRSMLIDHPEIREEFCNCITSTTERDELSRRYGVDLQETLPKI